MKILAFESSCDETAAAVVEDGRKLLSSTVSTQIQLHRLYGGVVPELASRRHVEDIDGVCAAALDEAGVTLRDIDAIAVTAWPGLIGALLVGVHFAKGLAYGTGLPLVPVHHLRSHVAANYLGTDLEPPFLALVVSGGNTVLLRVNGYTDYQILGRTRDDAAGECLDKTARLLGLPYPGGAAMDRLAGEGNPAAFVLPDAVVRDHPLDMSFSGLKTAAVNLIHNCRQKGEELSAADMAASLCVRVAETLTSRLERAVEETGITTVALAGGVTANSVLRARVGELAQKKGLKLWLPPLSLCGDNAAMVAAQGYFEYLAGHTAGPELNALAVRSVELG